MSNKNFHPSRCSIERAELIPLSGEKKDITALISEFSITQSLDKTALYAVFQVYDGVGILEEMPVRGEETFDVEIKCFDLETVVNLNLHVYKVDGIVTSEPNDAVLYTLHTITKTSYQSSLKRITKAYRDQHAHTIAKDIFKIGYGSGNFEVQDTEGTLRMIIPKYTPSEALRWLTMKSFSQESKSCSYRFFENFDGYFFVSDEYLARKARAGEVKELNYSATVTLDPTDPDSQIKQIEHLQSDRRINVGEELQRGSYFSSVMEIDVNNHTAKRFNYDYVKELAKYVSTAGDAVKLSQDTHSEDFIKSTFNEQNAKQFMLYRDFDDTEGGRGPIVRGEQYYKEIIQNRNSYDLHLNATQVMAKLKGRLDIKAGDFVKVNARKFNIDGKVEINEQLSGEYMVFSSTHAMSESLLDTTLTLIKYDWHKRG